MPLSSKPICLGVDKIVPKEGIDPAQLSSGPRSVTESAKEKYQSHSNPQERLPQLELEEKLEFYKEKKFKHESNSNFFFLIQDYTEYAKKLSIFICFQ